jgi:hypothetical protein
MKKHSLLFLLLLIAASCRHPSGFPYNKSRWKIPGDYEYMTLKGSPHEVREFQYSEGETPTGITGKDTGYYFRYSFDPDGNLTGRDTYMSGQLALVSRVTYSASGYVMRTWPNGGNGRQDTSILDCYVLPDGRFKTISNHHRDNPVVSISAFSDDGEKCIRTSFHDSSATGKPVETDTAYYDGQKLLKREILDASQGNSEQRLCYSHGNSPDSILFLTAGVVKQKQVYVNNQWGDPERYIELDGADSAHNVVISYTYDARGNWIKERETSFTRPAFADALNPGGGKTVFVKEREISY